MNRKIIVNHKEFKMEKMSADTYMEYLELAEQIDAATSERASKRYSRQEIEAMMLFICKAYGNQFTVDELKDAESGLDAAGIVIEFNMIDMGIAEEIFQSSLPRGERQQFSPKSSLFSQQKLSKIFNLNNKLF